MNAGLGEEVVCRSVRIQMVHSTANVMKTLKWIPLIQRIANVSSVRIFNGIERPKDHDPSVTCYLTKKNMLDNTKRL